MLFLLKLVTMESVRAINVPMYSTLRRTTVAFTMIVEYLLTGSKHSYPVVGRYTLVFILLADCFIDDIERDKAKEKEKCMKAPYILIEEDATVYYGTHFILVYCVQHYTVEG